MTNNYSKFLKEDGKEKIKRNISDLKNDNMNVRSYRMQEEFGPKKFIKPWRTGTKSQQQIPPRGQKKGFRGKSVSSK